jgi:ubiquinone/menaquinone biosynthesis C-methylase UbiE
MPQIDSPMIETLSETFVDPQTKEPLERDSQGNLTCRLASGHETYRAFDGCYDFCASNPDVKEAREAYDKHYGVGESPRLTLAGVTDAWADKTVPWRKTMLESLGSLAGKRVLLLGNGKSYIEFYFAHLGAKVVFTDLSLVAARKAKTVFRNSEFWEKHQDNIEFHAVDAMRLPFPDQSFDVVYGTKFVGFLPSQKDFFLEVSRVLKPGGKCRFCDDARSPAWEAVRTKLVHPLKAMTSRSGLAKVRSNSIFSFEEKDLESYVQPCGFTRLVFVPQYFFLRVSQLSWARVAGWSPERERFVKPFFRVMRMLDDGLANTKFMKRNSLALTWGFDK